MKLNDFTTDKLKAKLLAKTDIQESGCWIWTGSNATGRSGQTYGQLRLSSTCAILANRVSFHAFKGPIPKGHYIAHTCGNKACINPDHLKSSKTKPGGRPRSFNEAQAKEIIRLRKTGMRLSHIAEQFNLPYYLVAAVMHGKTWKHLREPSPN